MAGQNKGYFLPTTQSWDSTELYEADVNSKKFKELIVRMSQNLGLMAQQVNQKTSGIYDTQEFASGDTFFPNPSYSSTGSTFASFRPVFRKVVNMLPTGTLPNAGTLTVAHGLTFSSSVIGVGLTGTATDATGTSMISLPYASPVLVNNIELKIDATNVYIITGSDRTNYTKCYVIIEFLKN